MIPPRMSGTTGAVLDAANGSKPSVRNRTPTSAPSCLTCNHIITKLGKVGVRHMLPASDELQPRPSSTEVKLCLSSFNVSDVRTKNRQASVKGSDVLRRSPMHAQTAPRGAVGGEHTSARWLSVSAAV